MFPGAEVSAVPEFGCPTRGEAANVPWSSSVGEMDRSISTPIWYNHPIKRGWLENPV